ncbi:MAG TPA: hypothetical protein VGQ59_02055 [Cyclobacteriaceae bacterium]|jgi:hypothetical protein|nr:hypothetical protein [Cyclobacteriaceae bacterium]
MLPTIKIINGVLVRKFYERHASLLFFVFYLMFGMVESGQIVSYHLALIHGAISSPVFMMIVLGIWMLYLIKAVLLLEECFAQPHNLFFKQIGQLNKPTQFFLLAYTYVLIYQPVLIYSIVMIVVAFKSNAILAAMSMIAFHFIMISLCAWRSINSINTSRPSVLAIPSLRWPFAKPYPVFYISLLTDRFRIMLLLTKTFTILCLLGFLQIPLDHYESRLAHLGMAIAITSYSVIIFEWRQFEDQYLQFARALPITLTQRFLVVASAYAILLLPEFVVLLFQGFYLWDALIAILLSLGFALFAHSSLYQEKLNNDRHIQRVLWLFLITFFLALSKLALPAAILFSLIGWWRFRKNFEAYEASTNTI